MNSRKKINRSAVVLIVVLSFSESYQASAQSTDAIVCEKEAGEKAVSACSRLISTNAKNAFYFYWRGIKFAASKDFDNAIKDFTSAININPNKVLFYIDRGVALYKSKEFDRALADFNKAILRDPRDSLAYYNRATINGKKRGLRQADRRLQ